MLHQLLSCTEPQLLVQALHSLKALFTRAGQRTMYLSKPQEIKDQLDLLVIHPFAEIAAAAGSFEVVLDRYLERMEDVKQWNS